MILGTGEIREYQKDVHYPNTSGVNSSSYCIWHYTACVYQCSLIPHSNSPGFQTACQCSYPTVWMNGQCQRNCSADPNAAGQSPYSVAECACKTGYFWNSTINACFVKCSLFEYTYGIINESACYCRSGFYWDNNYPGCIIGCSSIAHAKYNDSISSCKCMYHYSWDDFRCKLDCLTVVNANPGLTDGNCTCKNAYSYLPDQYACKVNCIISGSTGTSVSLTEC